MGNGRNNPRKANPTGPLTGMANGFQGAVEVAPEEHVPKTGKADRPVTKVFTPYGDLVCGWLEPQPDRTQGGVILTDKLRNEFQTAVLVVVAVGPKVGQFGVGDRLLVGSGAPAMKAFVGDDTYLLVREEHVMGVFDPPTPTTEARAVEAAA